MRACPCWWQGAMPMAVTMVVDPRADMACSCLRAGHGTPPARGTGHVGVPQKALIRAAACAALLRRLRADSPRLGW